MLGPNTLPIGGLRAPTTWVVHTIFLTHGSYQVVGGILSQVLRALHISASFVFPWACVKSVTIYIASCTYI